MNKEIYFSNEAREKLLVGVDKLAKAVICTLGPSGRNVLIKKGYPSTISTKDGVTVAKSIELEDKIENIGAQLVKQASIKTGDQAGDGTTTSTLLARELYKEGLRKLSDGSNAVDIRNGINSAVERVVEYLKTLSKEVTDESQLKQVATISANNDKEVGELIATAMEKVGRDGVITIEESTSGETYLETVEGMQFPRGYKSPYFVTDNSTMQAILKNPVILITDKRITHAKDIVPLLEAVSSQNKALLIIAEDIEGEALSTLVVNKMRGIIQAVAVKAPDFGDRRKAILEDIATLTGGVVVSTEKGMRLDKFLPEWLGKCKKVTVGKDTTTIVDAQGDANKLMERVEELKTQIEENKSNYEIERLQERLAAFLGGVVITYVGGHTEVEMKEKKDRVDDALHATRAAVEEGILPGGGIALLNAKIDLDDYLRINSHNMSADEIVGYGIVGNAIEKPFTQILINAGNSETHTEYLKLSIMEEKNSEWYGYNTRDKEFVDMFEKGIIDPTKVTRLALQNAASVAGTMLITEAIIPDLDKKEDTTQGVDPSMFM